jgi:prepilin peptidase CpaA
MPDVASAISAAQPAALAVVAVLLLIAALSDIATRTIPDRAALGVAAIGVAIRLADHSAVAALAASAAVFLLGALCWRFGWLGGGDVKLLAACAWLVPPVMVPQLVLLTALAGGVLACLYLVLSCVARAAHTPAGVSRSRSLFGRIGRVEWWRIRRRAALPYGCAIAVATLLTLSER